MYFFNKSEVTQTEFANGDKILLFKNGQLEKHFINGTKQIYYNDGSQKFINYWINCLTHILLLIRQVFYIIESPYHGTC